MTRNRSREMCLIQRVFIFINDDYKSVMSIMTFGLRNVPTVR